MRALAQPVVTQSAAIAAALTALASTPRLVQWRDRPLPLWYLELSLLLAAFVLWSFVFAWHERYAGRKPFALSRKPLIWSAATLFGLAGGLFQHFVIDPVLRTQWPDDFPRDVGSWLAMTLFSLGFTKLFLMLAPADFFLRLVHRRYIAVGLMVLFNLLVIHMKFSEPDAPPLPFGLPELLVMRIVGVLLAMYFYLEGGVWVFWWWAFLLQSRHLLGFAGY